VIYSFEFQNKNVFLNFKEIDLELLANFFDEFRDRDNPKKKIQL